MSLRLVSTFNRTKMSKELRCVLLFCLLLIQSHLLEAASLTGNGYRVTVAISEDSIDSISDAATFVTSLRESLSAASRSLFVASDNKVYFQTVDVLLPRSWAGLVSGSTPSSAFSYLEADIRVEDTYRDDGQTLVLAPRTHHSKLCGYSGEYIILPPQFFLNQGDSTASKYGDIGKTLVHEWAHYRYGVFEEYGYPDSEKFPYSFRNTKGDTQVTSCNNTEIEGVLSTRPDGPDCTIGADGCRFRPDLSANEGPSTSLMFMQYLPTATKFCDSSNHDLTAPNQHNYWCRNRSVKTVMTRHPDFSGLQSRPDGTDTTPLINLLTPAVPSVYIVLDVSTHSQSDDTFSTAKNKLNGFFDNLVAARGTTPVSLLAMGGSSYDTALGLGGYLKTIVPPVPVQANLQTLRLALNGLERQESGLLVDRALLDVCEAVKPNTYLSGSIVLLVKLNPVDDSSARPVESEIISMLNLRNARLVTIESVVDDKDINLERVTELSEGFHFPANDPTSLPDTMEAAFNRVVNLINGDRFRSRRMQVGLDEVTISPMANVTATYSVDLRNSDLFINIHVPTDRDINIRLFDTRNIKIFDSSQLNTAWNVTYQRTNTSWNLNQFNIHSMKVPKESTIIVGQYRYEISYNGETDFKGYIDAVVLLPSNALIGVGGGGSPQTKPYQIEAYTSADPSTNQLNLGSAGEDRIFMIYAEVTKGAAIVLATEVSATVQDPKGVSSRLILKDDGIYPDTKSRDGVYTGIFKPTVNGVHRVSINAYRRNPNTPVATLASEPLYHALPIDQQPDYPYCYTDCGLATSTALFRRVVPYATQLTVTNIISFRDRPRRILDLKLVTIAADDSTATLSWTAPYGSQYTNVGTTSYKLVYSDTASRIIDESGLIPLNYPAVNPSDVTSGSLDPASPGSLQTLTINLNRVDPCYPLYFTISSKTNGIESYPAPLVFAPRRCEPEVTTSTTNSATSTTSATVPPTTTGSQTSSPTASPTASPSITTPDSSTGQTTQSTPAGGTSVSTDTTANSNLVFISISHLIMISLIAFLLT